jgi:hypothetical protein
MLKPKACFGVVILRGVAGVWLEQVRAAKRLNAKMDRERGRSFIGAGELLGVFACYIRRESLESKRLVG